MRKQAVLDVLDPVVQRFLGVARLYPHCLLQQDRSLIDVVVDEVNRGAGDFHTVIEVHATDSVGLLYAITRALADLELDILLAKVATYGEDVVDAFYVRDLVGEKVVEPDRIAAIEAAITARLGTRES